MGRTDTQGVPETLQALQDFLHQQQIETVIEQNAAAMLSKTDLPTVAAEELQKRADLLIVVGGDGALLHAAHIAVDQNLPILGINRGRLGFLTDIPPNELEKVGDVLAGNYHQEARFLLAAELSLDDKTFAEDIALNDVVLQPGQATQLIQFNIFINQEFVCSQRADGMIIATPTGSTAYALSGGGPILHSQLEAMVLVPMFPHKLTSRPIVVNSNDEIEITLDQTKEPPPSLSCDGQPAITLPPNSKILVRRHQQLLHLIHPLDYSYYTTLREKLGWERLHQQ